MQILTIEPDPSRFMVADQDPRANYPQVNSRTGNPKKKELGFVPGIVLPDNVPHLVLGLFPIVFICEKPRKIGNQLCAQWVVGQVRL